MFSTNLQTLKIHKLTQAQYERELSAGRIDSNALYLTEDKEQDLSYYATKQDLESKSDKGHTHTISEINELNNTLNTKSNKGHTHSISEINELNDTLNTKSDKGHTHNATEVGADIAGSATQALSDAKAYTDSTLINKADKNHNHDSLYDAKNSASNALAFAKTYTDGKVANLISSAEVDSKISSHNVSGSAHNDIRTVITTLTNRFNALANSDDETLDQLKEIVTYIKSNKNLIDSVTTNKVSVSDIINNLTTNVSNKPLSAAQGVTLKGLVDNLTANKANASHTHAIANITNLQSTLNAKQPLESTTFSNYSGSSYVSVRTPTRTANQYYEFWDGVGWADIQAGKFTSNSGGFVGDLTGNATSATTASSLSNMGTLTTSESVNNFIASNKLQYALFQTQSDIGVGFASHDGMLLSIPWNSTTYGAQIAIDDNPTNPKIAIRGKNTSWGNWKILPFSDGTNASGTWGINIAGNAGSATKLATARTISLTGSVTGSGSFDGSGNLSIVTTTSHTHTYISSVGDYQFTSSTLPNSFSHGLSLGFVNSNSGFGNFGTVITARSYSGGGGTLQLYAPYSPNYGGTHIKARFGNYDSSKGNSWTDLKEVAWVTDIPTKYAGSSSAGGAATTALACTGNSATATKATYDSAGNNISSYLRYCQGANNYKTITVKGDANTYYPVIIYGTTSCYASALLNISRGYSETAPDTWNTSTHRGGLTACFLSNDSRYWDGNGSGYSSTTSLIFLYESYSTMIGGIGNSTSGLVVWLRGGTAVYHITCNNGIGVSTGIKYSSYTDSAGRVFAPRTTVDNASIKSYRNIGHLNIEGAAAKVKDVTNGNDTTFNYGASAISNPTYLAGWNGYELRGVSRTAVTVGYSNVAAKLGRGGSTSTPMTFNWSGQSGQPTWLWGGEDGSNMYVYNPSNFSVNKANYVKLQYNNEMNFSGNGSQTRIWFNYRNGDSGASSGNTDITEYYFGNKNAGTTGVTLIADYFSGRLKRTDGSAMAGLSYTNANKSSYGWGIVMTDANNKHCYLYFTSTKDAEAPAIRVYGADGATNTVVLTGKNYTSYAATKSHGNHVPTTQTANNAVFLRNDNTWQTVTPANIGAAAASHSHTTLTGVYTANGGAQPPSYVGANSVKCNMMNYFMGTTTSFSGYADVLMMNAYAWADVPYATALAIQKTNGIPRAWIAAGGNTSSWAGATELITANNIGSQSVNYANSANYAKSAGSANYAIYDQNGNTINSTYATKTELSGKVSDFNGEAYNLTIAGESKIIYDIHMGNGVKFCAKSLNDKSTSLIYLSTGDNVLINHSACTNRDVRNVYSYVPWNDSKAAAYGIYGVANGNQNRTNTLVKTGYNTSNVAYINIPPIYNGTTSDAANVFVSSAGKLSRSTSASKYKLNIAPINEEDIYPYNILKLNPKQWHDKASIERYSDLLTREVSGEVLDEDDLIEKDTINIDTRYGLIAEDVEAAGLDKYCSYELDIENNTKELEGIQYDRVATLLIPIVRDLVLYTQKTAKYIHVDEMSEDDRDEIANLLTRINSFKESEVIK